MFNSRHFSAINCIAILIEGNAHYLILKHQPDYGFISMEALGRRPSRKTICWLQIALLLKCKWKEIHRFEVKFTPPISDLNLPFVPYLTFLFNLRCIRKEICRMLQTATGLMDFFYGTATTLPPVRKNIISFFDDH